MQDQYRNVSEVGEFIPFGSNNDIMYEPEYDISCNNNGNIRFENETMSEGYYSEQDVINSMVNKNYNHISDVYNYGKTSIRTDIGMNNNNLNRVWNNQNADKLDKSEDQKSKSKSKDIFRRLKNTNNKINYLLGNERYNSPISLVELDTPNESNKNVKSEGDDYITINNNMEKGRKICFDKGIEYVQLRYLIQTPELAESMMSEIVNRLNFIDGTIKLLKSQYEILEKISPGKEEIRGEIQINNGQNDNNHNDDNGDDKKIHSENGNEKDSNIIDKQEEQVQETFPMSDFLKNYSITLAYEHLRDTLESANKCLNDATKIKEKIEKRVNFSMSLMRKAKKSLRDNKQISKKYIDLSTKYKNKIMNIGKEILSVENKLNVDDTEPNDIGSEITRIDNDLEMIRIIKEALLK